MTEQTDLVDTYTLEILLVFRSRAPLDEPPVSESIIRQYLLILSFRSAGCFAEKVHKRILVMSWMDWQRGWQRFQIARGRRAQIAFKAAPRASMVSVSQ